MELVLYYLGAGLLGSVPFALLLGRLKGLDLRTMGSGNPGATNLARGAGFHWGVAAFVLDAGKGYVPILLGPWLIGDAPWHVLGGGVIAVAGHCFSPFLGFRGGKGVATAAGVLAGLEPLLFGILLATWGLILAILRNVGMASSLAAAIGGGIGSWRLLDTQGPPTGQPVAVLLVVLAAVIIIRHHRNLADFFVTKPPEARE